MGDTARTEHEPITTHSPSRTRPPYDKPDPALDQRIDREPPEAWEHWVARLRNDHLEALTETLRLVPTPTEHNHLAWLCEQETSVVAVVASLLDRQWSAGYRDGAAAALEQEATSLRAVCDEVEMPAATRKTLRSYAAGIRRRAVRWRKRTS